MVAEMAFQPTRGHGWPTGLGTLLRHEMQAFWGSRSWWVQVLVWTVFVQGLLLNSLAQAHGGAPGTEFASVAMGTFGVFGVIVLTHNAIVGEKQSGTAAWIMSKPVSRTAFVLARFLGAIGGYVAVVIAIEGAVAYAVLTLSGHPVAAPTYVGAMAAGAIYLLFFVALLLFLGTLFNARGPVLAIPLVAILLGQLFHLDLSNIAAALLPAGHSAISVSANSGGSIATAALAVSAIYVVLTIGLLAGAILRFSREEF
ncbi:MAG TPA: ABC transporter permease [Candidatus Dormibacteraeota bacterium]|nr:ABC transporter permease [Candidatus Dormibacteraeota bacterium]